MRFHFGVSFRWKTIKKFLLPILFGLLAYFGFGGIFDHFNLGIITANAQTNYNTQYNITIPNYDDTLKNYTCGTENVKDFIHNFIDNYSASNFHTLIFVDGDVVTFYSYSTSQTNVNRFAYYVDTDYSNKLTTFYMYNSTANNSLSYLYNIKFTTCDSNISTSQSYLNYYNYIYNNAYADTYTDNTGSFAKFNWNYTYIRKPSSITSFNNNSSYDIDYPFWYYWSSRDLNYKAYNNNTLNYSNTYFKQIHITNNDTTYDYLDDLVSFYDIKDTFPDDTDDTFIGYQTSLNTFYTNLNVSSFNNYNLKFKFRVPQSLLGFYQTPQEYLDNLSFSYSCGGRVDNTTYYTYENFNCSLTSSYTLTENTLEFTFNNLSSDQVLTNYDKIFVTIKPNYLDSSVSTTVYDLSYTYSLGSLINTEYKGTIYDNFSNLPLNFRMYFSSNNSLDNSMLYVKKSSFANYGLHYIGFSNSTQNQTLVIGNSILANGDNVTDFISTNVTNSIDTGIMIYQQNSSIVVPDLKLIFNGGMVISINNSNSSDTFYYIDNSGTIQSDNFVKPVSPNEDITSYDISYYTGYVSSFIDDLSSSSLLISVYTQNFYNSLPLFFQTFIFVMFILACIYFVYLLIKR